MKKLTEQDLKRLLEEQVARQQGILAQDATKTQMYEAVCMVVRNILTRQRVEFKKKVHEGKYKQVFYMSMEFLPGRSLKNHLFNIGLTDKMAAALKELGYDLEELEEIEPDAGLGNGGLGRLASAYMDALTSEGYPACGFSIKYDYGIFQQKIVDGWQVEMPDRWLEKGDVWLAPRPEETFEVHFGGKVEEYWNDGVLKVELKNYTPILALAYDMHISGYDNDAVNRIRLWSAKSPTDFDMHLFNQGEYLKAMENQALAESISKVLYPADNNVEGKMLRLKQQYFFVSASVQSILRNHLKYNPSLDNLADLVAIHINDTHPTLVIPELMRLLIDEHGYGWEAAWDIVRNVISYTNHTVMAEALEKWPQGLVEQQLPRIYQLIVEMNRRYCIDLWEAFPNDWDKVSKSAIMAYGEIRMANLCLYASHTINGVSALHSDILKKDVFNDVYKLTPARFTNVTNGITHRRWLAEANPLLTECIKGLIGDKFIKDADLSGLMKYADDATVMKQLAEIKHKNKERLAKYILDNNGVAVDTNSIFDVQVKRLHEYKRQLLNALHILDLYCDLKDNPDMDFTPRTFIFSAKAASSYYVAKLIIRLIYTMGNVINNDPDVRGRIKVVFLENYRVSLAEIIMPASEVSEQISVAGKEASGTGNMKFMINGAVTIGTMDGANVEIFEHVGKDNIFIFGLSSDEVHSLYQGGYEPTQYYRNNYRIRRVIDMLRSGIGGVSFHELADLLTIGRGGSMADPYMVLADFDSYAAAQKRLEKAYNDPLAWNKKSLINVAQSGFFAADRAVKEYGDRI
ncbi:MAG: glycogen/starch/alpha-glucan phosphorylase, partial [Clostridia bacterium]|nr:glycogen/starch/alpha-glucan phosphorylase [Clostridia bacterium]